MHILSQHQLMRTRTFVLALGVLMVFEEKNIGNMHTFCGYLLGKR